MPSAKTQGFALSALPRSSNIPANAGSVDVKEIYDGVRQGLANLEMVRRAPASMLLADAEMKAGTEQAPMKTAVLAESVAQAPVRTRNLLAQTRQIEAETTPEFLDAKMRQMVARLTPAEVLAFDQLTKGLTPEQRAQALEVHMGLRARPSSAAIKYDQIVGPDGRTYTAAFDPRAVGAHVIGTGQTYGSGVPAPNAPTAPAASASMIPGALNLSPAAPTAVAPITDGVALPVPAATQAPTAAVQPAAPATVAQSPFASPTAQEKKFQEASGTKSAEAIQDAKTKLPKARANLDSLESTTKRVESDIDQAISLADNWTAGFGALLKNVPKSEAMKLASIITAIKANVGFTALQDMRTNSPTGGALGQISDFENKLLQATIADLEQQQDPPFLKAQLLKIKKARADALARLRQQYDREVNYFGLTDADFSSVARGAQAPITGTPQEGEFKIVEIK